MIEPRPISSPTTSGPSRRQVLRGGAAAAVGIGAAVTFSACAGGGAQGGQPAGPRTLDQPVEVVKGDVPVGSGIINPDERLVVTQPTAGEFHAFSAVCPHQGCLVSLVRNDAIVCACHTSRFAITDGSRISGPAQSGLPAVRVTQDGNNLRVG